VLPGPVGKGPASGSDRRDLGFSRCPGGTSLKPPSGIRRRLVPMMRMSGP